MINIITGDINSGKTSKLIDIFHALGNGDGFYNRKVYSSGHFIGQEIVRLSSGERKLWSCRKYTAENWQEVYCYDVYSFSKEGLNFAEDIIASILRSGTEPIFIDEIGPLELQEKGFHNLFNTCLECGRELYIVIRESCVEAVVNKYNIQDYKIIYTNTGKKNSYPLITVFCKLVIAILYISFQLLFPLNSCRWLRSYLVNTFDISKKVCVIFSYAYYYTSPTT